MEFDSDCQTIKKNLIIRKLYKKQKTKNKIRKGECFKFRQQYPSTNLKDSTHRKQKNKFETSNFTYISAAISPRMLLFLSII